MNNPPLSAADMRGIFPPAPPEKLKVFAVKASGKWCGGMAIVAAHDEEEARLIAATKTPSEFHVRYYAPDKVSVISATSEGEPRVLCNFEIGE